MTFTHHEINSLNIAELNPTGKKLTTSQEFLQMLMDAQSDFIIIHQASLDESFFDLSNGLAGDMLQKVVNYRIRLAIVGDFSIYESKSVKAFIAESNRSTSIAFVGTIDEALKRLTG